MKFNFKSIQFKSMGLKPLQWTKQKKVLAVIGAVLVVVIIVAGIAVAAGAGSEEEYVYKETQVKFGSLVVGVTESGSVDIGTVEQTFDLDMSALQRVETGNSGSGSASGGGSSSSGGMSGGGNSGSGISNGGMSGSMGGFANSGGMSAGLNMFDQIFSMSSGSNITDAGEDSSLTVANVYVSVGQQVAEGDALYELEAESVAELEQKLQSNVEKAKADLDAVYAEQELSGSTAEYTYQSSLAYGDYAATEYNAAVQELQDAVTESSTSLTRAKETLSSYEEQLASITSSYHNALQILENCEYSLRQNSSSEDLYSYIYYFELTEQAQSTVDSLERQKEQLESNVEQAQSNVETAETSYDTAQRNLEKGLLSAKQTLALRELAYDTAQETYDIAIAYLEDDAAAQEAIYQEAQEEWEEFSSHISGNTVCANYNGVITSVDLAVGDSINTGSVLVSLYDMEDVSMTVTVYEEDMADIALGSRANISFTAYPDDTFIAEVTEISDASTDSSGNVTYEVTATIQGDVSGLFQGMTGDITFVTEQSENVLYVSKRAVITENDKNYVKIKDENGNIKRIQVITGFTDGTYIQIKEGLSEGDTVLIESKVSGS